MDPNKHWLNYSDLIAAFADGLIRSHRWEPGRKLVSDFQEKVELFAGRIEGLWPPAISPKVSLIEVDLRDFNDFLRHFLRSECWQWSGGEHFDLDGIRLDVMQALRQNINQFEGVPAATQ